MTKSHFNIIVVLTNTTRSGRVLALRRPIRNVLKRLKKLTQRPEILAGVFVVLLSPSTQVWQLPSISFPNLSPDAAVSFQFTRRRGQVLRLSGVAVQMRPIEGASVARWTASDAVRLFVSSANRWLQCIHHNSHASQGWPRRGNVFQQTTQYQNPPQHTTDVQLRQHICLS